MDVVEFIASYRIIPLEIHTLVKRREIWLQNKLINTNPVNLPYDVLHTYNPNFAIETYLLNSLYTDDQTLGTVKNEYVFAAAVIFAGIQLRLRANSNQQLDSSEFLYLLAERPSLSLTSIVRALDQTHLLLHLVAEQLPKNNLEITHLVNEIGALFCERTKRAVNQFLVSSNDKVKITQPEMVYVKPGESSEGVQLLYRRQIGSFVGYRLGTPSRYIAAIGNLTQGRQSTQMSIILLDKQDVILDFVSLFGDIARLLNIVIKMLRYRRVEGESIDCLFVANISFYPENFRQDFNLGDF